MRGRYWITPVAVAGRLLLVTAILFFVAFAHASLKAEARLEGYNEGYRAASRVYETFFMSTYESQFSQAYPAQGQRGGRL
jgi:hypothetical protein